MAKGVLAQLDATHHRKLVASAATCVVELPMEDSIQHTYFWSLDESCFPPHIVTAIRSTVEHDEIHV